MDRLQLVEDLSYSYHILSSYTDLIADKVSDDLDFMLFDAHKKKDVAKQHIRLIVSDYIDNGYQDDVDEYIVANRFLLKEKILVGNDLYQYSKTYSKIKGDSILFSRWMWESEGQLDLLKCYHSMQSELKKIESKTSIAIQSDPVAYEAALLRWGEFIKTEIANDGFDAYIIVRKLLDLIYTITCMEYVLQ